MASPRSVRVSRQLQLLEHQLSTVDCRRYSSASVSASLFLQSSTSSAGAFFLFSPAANVSGCKLGATFNFSLLRPVKILPRRKQIPSQQLLAAAAADFFRPVHPAALA